MKKLSVLCVVASTIILAGCAKEKAQPVGGGSNNGVLTVGIKSSSTRAAIDPTNTADAVEAFEGNVVSFSAYVFNWDTGDLEASVTSPDASPVTILGLNTAGAKRVVVVANGTRTALPGSFIPQFEENPNYSRMADGYVALADQSFTDFTDLTKGFLMTGENTSALQLTPGTNQASITVKRVVAKVQLGEITFDKTVQLSDLAAFDLTEAVIQRATGYSTLGTGAISIPNSPVAWVGGEMGSISKTLNPALTNTLDLQTYLTDLYTTHLGYSGLTDEAIGEATIGDAMDAQSLTSIDAFENELFWYVLPNGDPEKFTLLTLKGSYNGTDYYYPIEINDPDVIGTGTDGEFIKRNTIYTVNLHFKHLTGIADPDLPGVAASIEVTVEPAPWAGPVIQESTW